MKERWTVRWFRKRALLYHLFVVILAPGCLWAGWWQVQRAESGNTLSYLYSFEWPVFAILSVIGWWQLIHEDPAAVESRKVERARRAATRGPFVPPPPDADSGFYHPLQPGSYATLGPVDDPADPAGLAVRSRVGEIDAVTGAAHEVAEGEPAVHALSTYNAYLARLSAGGGRKSWRNPHGLTSAIVRANPSPAVTGGRDTAPALDAQGRPEVAPGSAPGPTAPPPRLARRVPAADEDT